MGFTLDLSLEKELFFAASNQYSLVKKNVLPVAELDVRLVFILIYHLMSKVGGGSVLPSAKHQICQRP